jgi:hypothetical protein
MIELAIATMIACESPTLTRGSSGAAEYVYSETERARKRLRDSYSLGWGGEEVFTALEEVQQECSVPGWDGYHADAVAPETHYLAKEFLKALPLGIPAPTVSADPDGQITFEWYRSPRKTVSVSVSPDGDLHFSALNGSSSVFGSEPFYGKAPRNILEVIQRLKIA